jgi:hypothetical protein
MQGSILAVLVFLKLALWEFVIQLLESAYLNKHHKFQSLEPKTNFAVDIHCEDGPIPNQVNAEVPPDLLASFNLIAARSSLRVVSVNIADIWENIETSKFVVDASNVTLPSFILPFIRTT